MTIELEALARRVIDCKSWRWMPGIRSLGGWRFISVDTDKVEIVNHLYEIINFHKIDLPHIASSLPDLSDPATLGCLISLIQEAYNKKIVISIGSGWWSIQTDYKDWDGDNTSSVLEALVLALEAAP
jgi:hypothetical protein